MVLRRLAPLSFCAFVVLLHTTLISEAAPLAARFQHPRQDEIASLASNITGQTVSDGAALAQTLGSLFGDNSSATADTPSATLSDSSAEITGSASVPSLSLSDDTPSPTISDSETNPTTEDTWWQLTSTSTIALPTGGGSDAEDVLSQLAGALASILPSILPTSDPNSGSWPSSSGSEGPGNDPIAGGFPWGSVPQGPQQPPDCAETYTAVAGDSCEAISSIFDVSPVDFLRMNPTVGAACTNLEIGQMYCVRRGSAQQPSSAPQGPGSGQPGMTPPGSFPPVPPGTPQSGVTPPSVPSTPVTSSPSDLPLPAPPTPTGLNSTGPPDPIPSSNSTDSTSDPTPGLNSTDPISDPPVRRVPAILMRIPQILSHLRAQIR
ncbi:hypothetical protein B0H13DRAFT_1865289 [Mycena leptocephala]|nr:hypothetical protein B0H13DRAFT_1865289 [Mycena leptocephala]